LPLALATMPLAGCLLGFLRYNFNGASVFLGDSGSLLIGFMLGKGGGVDAVFLMFAVVAIVGLIAATRMIETRNLRLEEISR